MARASLGLRWSWARFAAIAPALLLVACSKREPEPSPAASAGTSEAVVKGVQTVKAAAGDDVASVVREARANAPGRELVVYVGATWCEPCQRFHEAAARGELDEALPNLTLLEFDLDVDRERLIRGGYGSEMIPLFVLPGPDGRASEKRFEGSVKGPRAISNIVPRLRELLSK